MSDNPHIMKTVGHYSDPVYPWLLLGSSLVPVLMPEFTETRLYTIASSVVSVILVFMILSNVMSHWNKYCDRCAHLMLLIPDKSAEQAKKETFLLRLTHWGMDIHLGHIRIRKHYLPIPLFIGLLFTALIADTLISRLVGTATYSADVSHLFVFAIPVGIMCWSIYRHKRLQPWCPFCKDNGGGDGDEVVEPTPDPAISR